MSLFNLTTFKFYCLFLCVFLQGTISGCTTIQNIISPTSDSLNSAIGETNKAFSAAKKLASNLGIKSSSNRDLDFALQQFNQSNFGVAEFYLKKTLVKLPGNPAAVKLLPWAHFYQKQYDKALTTFKRTKALYKKNPEPLIGMGWCYFALRRYERAIEQFEYAKKLDGDYYQINKGKAFAQLK